MPGRDHVTGESINLERDFPQIEDIDGTVEIKPSFGGLDKEVKTFTRANLPDGYIACNNPVCNYGGVSLRDVLRFKLYGMVRNKETEGKQGEFCSGYEKMGRGLTRPCRTTFVHIEIHIKYREPEIGKQE